MPLVSLMIFIISPYHLESGNDITEDEELYTLLVRIWNLSY